MIELTLLKIAERKIAKLKALAKKRTGIDPAAIARLVEATPEEIRKAASLYEHIEGARRAGKGWWAEAMMRMIDTGMAKDAEIKRLKQAVQSAYREGFIDGQGDIREDVDQAWHESQWRACLEAN